MANTLETFRLESYDERSVLLAALYVLQSELPHLCEAPSYRTAIDTLMARLTRTQCQEGGCECCGSIIDD